MIDFFLKIKLYYNLAKYNDKILNLKQCIGTILFNEPAVKKLRTPC